MWLCNSKYHRQINMFVRKAYTWSVTHAKIAVGIAAGEGGGGVKKATTLTDEEKRVAKALLAAGMRNQDIHALINYERPVTVNFGRIAGVKKNDKIVPASPEEVAFFRRKKHSFVACTRFG
jgi:hypothetical protein